MFQQLCYQLYNQEVSKAEAEIICLQNGANLLHVETRMQHTFITAAFPASDHNHTQIWLDIEKEVDKEKDYQTGRNIDNRQTDKEAKSD